MKRFFISMVVCLMLLGSGRADAMSLNVQDGDVGELLRSIARMGNINIILDRSVTGSISLKVDEAEPEEMLMQIIRAGGFDATRDGNTWIVAGRGNLQQGFGRVHVLPVKYAPLQDIKNALEQYEITADRKSLYDDFNVLRDMGIDILGEQRGRSYYYHVGKKKFELAELKLLVDAIQPSKFITVKKSHELIRKLESFASRYEASKLQRQVVVTGRIKTMNECIYYNVDAIHSAIANNRMIQFQYFQWNTKKKMEMRHNGQFYKISP